MNICIIGGGNIGSLLLAELGSKNEHNISLLTSSPEKWDGNIKMIDKDSGLELVGKIDIITNEPSKAIEGVELIFITVPSHVIPIIIDSIAPYINGEVIIGVIPGSGGCEFFMEPLIKKGITFFGFQRVHSIARIKEYGKEVYQLGRKSSIELATIPKEKGSSIVEIMENLFSIPCFLLDNYLNVTLTPSNPILHTSRIYSIFKDYYVGKYYEKPILFYEEWNEHSSEILLACDEEMQCMCQVLDVKGIKSLKTHYESGSKSQLTNKIANIKAFKNIYTPMREEEDGYVPDITSRYFTEDFIFGLAIIKAFCEIANVKTPTIDLILRWYERITNSILFTENGFNGKDLIATPQRFNIKTVQDIVSFYNK